MTSLQGKRAMRYFVYGEGFRPDYATFRALIAKGLLTTDGRPTNLGRDVADVK